MIKRAQDRQPWNILKKSLNELADGIVEACKVILFKYLKILTERCDRCGI